MAVIENLARQYIIEYLNEDEDYFINLWTYLCKNYEETIDDVDIEENHFFRETLSVLGRQENNFGNRNNSAA